MTSAARLTPPQPCRADLDSDGVYGADDIFAFITLWFDTGPGSTCP